MVEAGTFPESWVKDTLEGPRHPPARPRPVARRPSVNCTYCIVYIRLIVTMRTLVPQDLKVSQTVDVGMGLVASVLGRIS